jgi:DMSO/TMAO reductase YedYZ molybdopterin-dependent catalytic subunit
MLTAVQTNAAAATSLTPREETVPVFSHVAASRFIVPWKYAVKTTPTTTSVNFTSNMPATRYCAGFDIHSVKPLTNWNAMAIQMTGKKLLNEAYGIVLNNPSRRRAMTNMKPTTVAVPNA